MYQVKCSLNICNCGKIILTHMVQNVSCLPIFLPENQISLTIILNDLIFYKLDVILKTLFSMHNILIWSLKKKRFINFNCVLLTIKLAVGPWNLGIMTLDGCLNLSYSHVFRKRQEVHPLYHFSCATFNHLRQPDFLVVFCEYGIQILARSWKFKILQKIGQNIKYKLAKAWGG